jgi:Protein of unknown function (DUF1553)/Protein of unknown function (DUF1549)/Planctomycete cytochrome C
MSTEYRKQYLRIASLFLVIGFSCPLPLALSNFQSDEIQPDTMHYESDVKSTLAERCFACHGALKQEAGLRLDTAASILRGGDSGPGIEPGSARSSLLIEKVRQSDLSLRMPPEGKPLTEEEIRKLEAWISSGAAGPVDEKPQQDPLQHWAFQPPKRFESTLQVDSSSMNVIDQILSGKQSKLGLESLAEADRRTLVRRLYIDLLGLPPTPEQVSIFLNDDSANAYERLVDHLLNQPEYGERWGRHWMDVWRYSDWYGRRSVPDVMNSYPQIWRWRDWIVRSLNEDKGYDRMIMEMLAADELCPTDEANVVAAGFLVRNWYKWNYETWMKDNVEHTGKAFLGLTLNCAHCHDHKYDPITHEDYFRFRAFFEPLELRHDRVAGLADPGPFKKYVYAESYGPIATGAIRVFDEKLEAKTFMYRGGDARNRIEGKEAIEASPPQSLRGENFAFNAIQLPPEASYPGLRDFVRSDEIALVETEITRSKKALDDANLALSSATLKFDEDRVRATQPVTAANRPSADTLLQSEKALFLQKLDVQVASAALATAESKLQALRSRIAADDARYRDLGDPDALARVAHVAEKQSAFQVAQLAIYTAERALAAAEQQAAIAAPDKLEAAKQEVTNQQQALATARTTFDSARAALNTVEANYTPLSPVYPQTSTGRRLALARWIVDRKNPLTARVAINHMWLRHFGQALVETADNFGIQGRPPLHPELLDTLAVELMENNWSMKHIHRLIVTSQAYRRSSNPQNAANPNFAIDRDNQNYWRFPLRRMEAEVVRDSVLACSGALDKKLGGPEIDNALWMTSPRRSMYFTIHGESKMQFIDTFDGPNVCECYRRTSTVLPQQALAMTNSELLVNYGRKLASKIVEEHSQRSPASALTDPQFVQLAFERVLSRPASEKELDVSLQFLESQRQLLGQSQADQRSVPSSKDVVLASSDIAQRARENLAISLFSHNDFVTVR